MKRLQILAISVQNLFEPFFKNLHARSFILVALLV